MESPSTAVQKIVPTAEGYDQWSQLYDADDNPLVMLEERVIGAIFGPVRGLRVADVGCGTGRHAIRLAADGARVTGLDFSEGMLARARTKKGAAQVRFVRHDLTQRLPFEDGSFDRVFCCLVVDHIGDLESFFTELRRLCAEQGAVVVSVMHPAMSLRGVQARFVDPQTGEKIGLESHVHVTSDYVMAAFRAGLCLELIAEHSVDEDLAAKCPRALKYLSWPLLLVMRFSVR